MTGRNSVALVASRFTTDACGFALYIALPLYAYTFGGATRVGLVLAAQVVGGSIGSAVATRIVSRYRGRLPIVAASVGRGLVIGSLALAPRADWALAVVVAAAFLNGSFASFARVAVSAQIVRLVPEAALLRTNALLSSASSFASVLGAIGGGAVMTFGNQAVTFSAIGGGFLVSAIFLAPLKFAAAPIETSTSAHSPSPGPPSGIRFSIVSVMLVVTLADTLGSAGHNVGMPLLAHLIDPRKAGQAMSYLIAAWAIGRLAGSSASARLRLSTTGMEVGFFLAVLVMSFSFSAAFFLRSLGSVAVLLALGGVSDGVSEVLFGTRLQRNPEEAQLRLFGMAAFLQNAGYGVGIVVCAPLFDRFSPGPIVASFHSIPVVTSLCGILLYQTLRARTLRAAKP